MTETAGLSVKLHNAIHVTAVDYQGHRHALVWGRQGAHASVPEHLRVYLGWSMRTRVYEMAQTRVGRGRKVIMSSGAGRIQEWRQMMVKNFSYIVIDLAIDVSVLQKNVRGVSVKPYNFNTEFRLQVFAAARRGSVVMWAKCQPKEFLALPELVVGHEQVRD
ncbi:hypothetical protein BU26DRAFT_353232 [Trematosphaeria pertusa]|uniref:Uncharacterized protein n=1 Tax=Trematosphaeria pertusa TaxID=390896 RepID=A0A6A6IE35_9PLEO|nr:uncharacterized protein BU26DRAFT_353232 [Trematosphaeria pertusa]KAF2247763.1 hypothetical protein BU26DRAFT_353232 [Trematosphaeria pertusa]